MQIADNIPDLKEFVRRARSEGRSIGFVPTMGALHAGHMSLINGARNENDIVVVSVFVNPLQFGPGEDYERYPRTFDADNEKCREAGVDLVFAPAVSDIYPEGYNTHVDVDTITGILEGVERPGHFRGVATVVLKLFNLVEPHRAYFGMKDYQQLLVIRKMVRDLNVNVEVVPMPTVREEDGLALSSRNAYLNPEERKAATILYRTLEYGKRLIHGGCKDSVALRGQLEEFIAREPLARVGYLAIADPETLEPLPDIQDRVLLALAVTIGNTRLIDNMLVTV